MKNHLKKLLSVSLLTVLLASCGGGASGGGSGPTPPPPTPKVGAVAVSDITAETVEGVSSLNKVDYKVTGDHPFTSINYYLYKDNTVIAHGTIDTTATTGNVVPSHTSTVSVSAGHVYSVKLDLMDGSSQVSTSTQQVYPEAK